MKESYEMCGKQLMLNQNMEQVLASVPFMLLSLDDSVTFQTCGQMKTNNR